MSVKFNIRPDMTAKQLLSEVKGRIAGENQVAVQEFERALNSKGRNLPTLRIKVEKDSALVQVVRSQQNKLGLLDAYSARTWLMGVNDEGTYYAHELQNIPKYTADMGELMDWVNRADEGFTERVQGDILVQFAPCKPEGGMAHDWLNVTLNGEKRRFSALFENTDMGNHEVIIPMGGNVYHFQSYMAVTGTEFTIVHPQHAMRTVQIPRGMAAVLAPQRGRTDRQLVD